MIRFARLVVPLLLSAFSVVPFTQAQAEQGWPRHIPNRDGELVINHQPERIVSTSVTLTGSLLAIGAPVVASGAAMPGHKITDQQGFFRQWGKTATEKGVKRLYTGEPNLEAIAAENPDLIIVSATGNDSALPIYERLSAMAPTLVVNYDDKSWQQVERILAQATGHEAQAEKSIQTYAQREKEVKAKLVLPPQPVSALVFNAHSRLVNLWTTESAQGKLLESLGFTLAQLPAVSIKASQRMKRKDIVPLSGENLVTGLTGNTVMMFATGEEGKAALLAEPLLAATPAVKNKQVYALGDESFRLDYYSASNLLTRLEQLFAKQ
ncbi:Fe2+-enterobactin ABC transporter substrate-binding protein [Pantoea sp. CCBC3-3-1]|uniref:Fe2+-enterobactin ABC transporter substrate-binding protein n=1 Tax=Pantoea sp. CCBC3-3-1 TaxID=2490851 RepID=UPI0011BDD14E|nr:Fe2+-enterobactin ABC transporter substrate-binding protein [Pantoea sp. CCBC3-3-1]